MFQDKGKDYSTFKFLVMLVRKSWVKYTDYKVSRFLVSCFLTGITRFIEKTSGINSEAETLRGKSRQQINLGAHIPELN